MALHLTPVQIQPTNKIRPDETMLS